MIHPQANQPTQRTNWWPHFIASLQLTWSGLENSNERPSAPPDSVFHTPSPPFVPSCCLLNRGVPSWGQATLVHLNERGRRSYFQGGLVSTDGSACFLHYSRLLATESEPTFGTDLNLMGEWNWPLTTPAPNREEIVCMWCPQCEYAHKSSIFLAAGGRPIRWEKAGWLRCSPH